MIFTITFEYSLKKSSRLISVTQCYMLLMEQNELLGFIYYQKIL